MYRICACMFVCRYIVCMHLYDECTKVRTFYRMYCRNNIYGITYKCMLRLRKDFLVVSVFISIHTYIHTYEVLTEIRSLFPHDLQDSSTLFVPYTCIGNSLKSKAYMDEEFFFFPVPSASSFSSESLGRRARAAAKKGAITLDWKNFPPNSLKCRPS